MEFRDMLDSFLRGPVEPLPGAALLQALKPNLGQRMIDEFAEAHIRKHARRIGLDASNTTAAVAFALQMPNPIEAGRRRADQLRARQRTTGGEAA